MNKYNKLELIEKYISGKLQGEKLITFQSEIAKDDDLKREIELEIIILQAAGNQEVNEFYQISKDIIYNENKIQPKPYKIIGILLIVLFLLSLILFFVFKTDKGTREYAYNIFHEAKVEQTNPYQSNIRSSSEEVDSSYQFNLWNKYYTSFNDRKFDSASKYLNELKIDFKDDQAINYQEALLLIISEDFSDAINLLLETTQSNDMSIWYLALCYLELGDRNMAIEWLETISNTIHPKQEDASQLLKLLHRE